MSISVFDNAASSYDDDFTNTAIGVLQRKRVYKVLNSFLKSGQKLLEINCGTGHDAIELSKHVQSVLATDISEKMIEVASKKLTASTKNVKFLCADIRNIHQKMDENVDIVFSNFGGLNCLSKQELTLFAERIRQRLNNNGILSLVIMGKKCWIENLWYFLKKDPRRNRRNILTGLPTTINGTQFLTYYYSPKEIETIFKPYFKTIKVKPVGLFIPPSYLNSLFRERKWLLGILYFAERIFGKFSFLSNYADHYIIVMVKRD